MLGETIKTYRKMMKLTQEQLANAMNVTVGAVSKWELGLSNPDVTLLPKLAKLFGISLDVLFSFDLIDETAEDLATKIKSCRHEKQYEKGSEIALDSIRHYPNNFDIVYQSASLFMLEGVEKRNNKALEKALELYKRCCPLIGQNHDPTISELSIQINIGEVLGYLGRNKEAFEQLNKYNYCGINDSSIGFLLVQQKKIDEALPYLSEALINTIAQLLRVGIGYANAYAEKKEYQSAHEMLNMMYEFNNHFRRENKVSYIDKMQVIILAGMAQLHASNQQFTEANSCLLKAYELAKIFDVSPDYNVQNIKFYQGNKQTFGDDAGETAMASVERILAMEDDNGFLLEAWTKIVNNS